MIRTDLGEELILLYLYKGLFSKYKELIEKTKELTKPVLRPQRLV